MAAAAHADANGAQRPRAAASGAADALRARMLAAAQSGAHADRRKASSESATGYRCAAHPP
jgi:hypothetical protein